MSNYNKALYEKELKSNDKQKEALKEAQVLIRKYRLQLQRSLGNIDILTEELNKFKNDIKTLRAKNSQQRLERDQMEKRISELEERIEALI
jgi:archaellum component FlaC